MSAALSPTAAYLLLFALVAGESAGLFVPGETALIAAGVLAGSGRLDIVAVVAIAAAGAVVGDNVGYAAGRYGGRRLLTSARLPFPRHRARLLDRGDAFFERHGGKAVFLGRFVTGVRVVVAWVAGVNGLPWRRFVVWNLLGGVVWAAAIGSLSYSFGTVIARDARLAGAVALGLALVAAPVVVLWQRRRRARSRRYGGGDREAS